MVTTIQLKEETKQALFLKKNQLERELSRKITYDELVMKLLAQTENARPRAELEDLIGIISQEEVDIYQSLRKEYQNE